MPDAGSSPSRDARWTSSASSTDRFGLASAGISQLSSCASTQTSVAVIATSFSSAPALRQRTSYSMSKLLPPSRVVRASTTTSIPTRPGRS